MSNRTISWNAALRDLKADRAARQPIREERLRSTAGMRGPVAALSAWRGRSGRRYVVAVSAAEAFATTIDCHYLTASVLIAVRRDEADTASVIRVTLDLDAAGARRWVDSLRRAGATEFHVHRLEPDAAGRAAIVADLSDLLPAVA